MKSWVREPRIPRRNSASGVQVALAGILGMAGMAGMAARVTRVQFHGAGGIAEGRGPAGSSPVPEVSD